MAGQTRPVLTGLAEAKWKRSISKSHSANCGCGDVGRHFKKLCTEKDTEKRGGPVLDSDDELAAVIDDMDATEANIDAALAFTG